jgi:hypothetical protein
MQRFRQFRFGFLAGVISGASVVGAKWYNKVLDDCKSNLIYTPNGIYYLSDYDNTIKELSKRVMQGNIKNK